MFDDMLLLKKGRKLVFYGNLHGDLGASSSNLVCYFEGLGSTPIQNRENPASWMLNVLGEKNMVQGEDGQHVPLDYAEAWKESSNYADLQQQLTESTESPDEMSRIKFDSKFALSWFE